MWSDVVGSGGVRRGKVRSDSVRLNEEIKNRENGGMK